ncbi:Uncharacterized protein AB751O23_CN_00030 [Chlamydiales bacterium SCGC AB-751-O23]|jgi:peptidoglycan DL-endopeptidase LytF|nr:Uncharacterized protein AB751O23_CN_00030 [Chlamydiales bacterium SCGC AB-751-O23]
MSRRDTIVVAVLINTGLLLILFVTAINSSDDKTKLSYEAASSQPATELVEVPTGQEESKQQVVSSESFESRANEVEQSSQENQSSSLGENTEEDTFVEVLVKRGDYLEKIAKNHSVSISDIVKLNGLTSTQLKVGQLIRIPIVAKNENSTVQNNVPAATNLDKESYYVVRSGDNPWLIAMRNGIDLEQLLKLNNLDEKKARTLRPGDKIRIR